jgi:uncharacterized membrane protein YbhN (UPF0104 family)
MARQRVIQDPTALAPSRQARWVRLAGWVSGALTLLAVLFVAAHAADAQRFLALLENAEPSWLIVGLGFQVLTYVAAAAVWYRVLLRAGSPLPLGQLVPLSVAKLFTDQVVPTGGISGTALIVGALLRRGIAAGISMAALLVGMVSYYGAFLLMLLAALLILAGRGAVTAPVVAIAAVFVAVATGLPAAVMWLRRRGEGGLPRFLAAMPGVAWLLRTLTGAPASLLRDRRLLVETVLLQAAIFVLDAATLWAMLLASGQASAPSAALAAFTMASVVAAIGPTPLGLGTFEASCVLTLRLFAVPVEAGVAATLLLRGLTTWLPMIPGLWLARRELRPEPT